MIAESIRFLCSEMDTLRAPAKVRYKLCYKDAKAPEYHTEGASGLDLHAYSRQTWINGVTRLGTPFPFTLNPGDSAMIWSGVAFEIPPGWEIQVRPRSSTSKARVHACLGTIDSDYRGEVGVLLINLGTEPFIINKGDRIAQAVFAPVGRFELEQTVELEPTKRGASGWGSTGK